MITEINIPIEYMYASNAFINSSMKSNYLQPMDENEKGIIQTEENEISTENRKEVRKFTTIFTTVWGGVPIIIHSLISNKEGLALLREMTPPVLGFAMIGYFIGNAIGVSETTLQKVSLRRLDRLDDKIRQIAQKLKHEESSLNPMEMEELEKAKIFFSNRANQFKRA